MDPPFRKAGTKVRLGVKVSTSFLILFVGFLWCLCTLTSSPVNILTQCFNPFAFLSFTFIHKALVFIIVWFGAEPGSGVQEGHFVKY